jgi:hypothetical protein
VKIIIELTKKSDCPVIALIQNTFQYLLYKQVNLVIKHSLS